MEWIEKTSEAENLALQQREKLEAQLKAESEQREKNISKAIGVYANEIEKLSSDLAGSVDQRMYVSTKTASCNSVGLPAAGKNEDPRGTGETVNAELSEPSATAIRGDYYAAANLELKYNMLTEIIRRSNCFEVIE
ncbi:MAG: hypothetical protein KF908_05165 [Nitrosomonas sp.]|nr:hypothetical protein [Nitrosomonas sp.]